MGNIYSDNSNQKFDMRLIRRALMDMETVIQEEKRSPAPDRIKRLAMLPEGVGVDCIKGLGIHKNTFHYAIKKFGENIQRRGTGNTMRYHWVETN